MKRLINDSLQSLSIWLITPPKNKVVWVQPKKSILVEDHQVSQMANTLSKRKMIRIVNVPNSTKAAEPMVQIQQPITPLEVQQVETSSAKKKNRLR